jgi:diacylglycerol kinase family enzyme
MLRDVLASLFERNRISASLEILPAADLRPAAERARQQVLDRKLDAIVVGAEMAVSGPLQACVFSGSDVPLGIIPAPKQAVAVIAAGEARSVDVGEVNGEFFVNNSSIGIYPYLLLERERRRRRQGLSKWTAMILAALRVARHLPVRRLVIRIEGWVEPCRSPCVFVGTTSIALQCPPSAGVTDWIEANWPSTWPKRKVDCHFFGLACRCILGFLDQERDLRVFKGRAAEIRSRASRLLVAFDGEVETRQWPLIYRTRPGALRVFAPAAMNA